MHCAVGVNIVVGNENIRSPAHRSSLLDVAHQFGADQMVGSCAGRFLPRMGRCGNYASAQRLATWPDADGDVARRVGRASHKL